MSEKLISRSMVSWFSWSSLLWTPCKNMRADSASRFAPIQQSTNLVIGWIATHTQASPAFLFL
jgi:hypothetical protein